MLGGGSTTGLPRPIPNPGGHGLPGLGGDGTPGTDSPPPTTPGGQKPIKDPLGTSGTKPGPNMAETAENGEQGAKDQGQKDRGKKEDKKGKKGGKYKGDPRPADQIIQQEKQGRIREKFPKQWLDKTYDQIRQAAQGGDQSAKTAQKLLDRPEYNK